MDKPLLAAAIALFVLLVIACLLPAAADSTEDLGDGQTNVVIAPYVKTPSSRPRTWVFFAVSAGLGLLYLGFQRPAPADAYIAMVRDLASAITRDPAVVNGYAVRIRAATAFLAVAYIVGISVVVRASLTRRAAMLFHVVIYLALSVVMQALMIVTGMATGWAIGPFGIEATLANLLVGGVVVLRLTFTSFVLPRATTVPKRRPVWVWDDLLAFCSLFSMVALLVVLFAFLDQPGNQTALWQIFVPLYAMSILFILMFAPLWALWWFRRRVPEPGADRPAIDVIIPAYNEEENLARLLRSIDVAAGRYGGPVRVVVSDDGSEDSTAQIAREEIFRFKHARGRVFSAPNGGQGPALNRAIKVTDSEIIVRIDGDCVMGPDALVYAIPWFRDPRIGTVGAMEEPRQDSVGWFHRLRVFEVMVQFRYGRLGQSVVDGIVCIPGTFTAFRREPAELCGGFPEGMNGEDADLTMMIGRLGYRAVVDPRIRSWEDVPHSANEFVEQRTRWSRAGFHVFARHSPLRSGSAGPRVWLWTVRRALSWFTLQASMVAPIFMVELMLAHPTYRQNVIAFFLLYAAGSAFPLLISVPFVIKYKYWRSLLWLPTWPVFAFLRHLATLEAVISLPTRPCPAWAGRRAGEPLPEQLESGAGSRVPTPAGLAGPELRSVR
jgi:cellulose synthase/poly-beta-1,6-N-acetylglucosamine synthase-like glycosyltransferase